MNTDADKEQEFTVEEPANTEAAAASAEEAPAAGESSLEDEVLKYKDAALRAHAELDNYRKRMVREKQDAIRYANASLVESLIPILDNFELGLSAAKTSTDASGIVQGLEMVRKQLEDFLKDNGIEVVDASGKPFDPNVHDAVAQEPSDEIKEGHVIRQIRRGFKLRDRLIRPASVVVSKGA